MAEPLYVAQTGDLRTRQELLQWYRERSEDARRETGCDHFRLSVHPDIPNLALIEGWKGYPENWDYGAPRFALTSQAAA